VFEHELSRVRGLVAAGIAAGHLLRFDDMQAIHGALYSMMRLHLPYITAGGVSPTLLAAPDVRTGDDALLQRRVAEDELLAGALFGRDISPTFVLGAPVHASVRAAIGQAAVTWANDNGVSLASIGFAGAQPLTSSIRDFVWLYNMTETLLMAQSAVWASGNGTGYGRDADGGPVHVFDPIITPLYGSPQAAASEYFLRATSAMRVARGFGVGLNHMLDLEVADVETTARSVVSAAVAGIVITVVILVVSIGAMRALLARQRRRLAEEGAARAADAMARFSVEKLRNPILGLEQAVVMLNDVLSTAKARAVAQLSGPPTSPAQRQPPALLALTDASAASAAAPGTPPGDPVFPPFASSGFSLPPVGHSSGPVGSVAGTGPLGASTSARSSVGTSRSESGHASAPAPSHISHPDVVEVAGDGGVEDLEESLELVATMATCVKTLKVLSANLADASAIVARGPASIRPRLQACQLPQLVQEVVHNARLQLAVASGIHIVLEVDPSLPVHACIDAMRARQVLEEALGAGVQAVAAALAAASTPPALPASRGDGGDGGAAGQVDGAPVDQPLPTSVVLIRVHHLPVLLTPQAGGGVTFGEAHPDALYALADAADGAGDATGLAGHRGSGAGSMLLAGADAAGTAAAGALSPTSPPTRGSPFPGSSAGGLASGGGAGSTAASRVAMTRTATLPLPLPLLNFGASSGGGVGGGGAGGVLASGSGVRARSTVGHRSSAGAGAATEQSATSTAHGVETSGGGGAAHPFDGAMPARGSSLHRTGAGGSNRGLTGQAAAPVTSVSRGMSRAASGAAAGQPAAAAQPRPQRRGGPTTRYSALARPGAHVLRAIGGVDAVPGSGYVVPSHLIPAGAKPPPQRRAARDRGGTWAAAGRRWCQGFGDVLWQGFGMSEPSPQPAAGGRSAAAYGTLAVADQHAVEWAMGHGEGLLYKPPTAPGAGGSDEGDASGSATPAGSSDGSEGRPAVAHPRHSPAGVAVFEVIVTSPAAFGVQAGHAVPRRQFAGVDAARQWNHHIFLADIASDRFRGAGRRASVLGALAGGTSPVGDVDAMTLTLPVASALATALGGGMWVSEAAASDVCTGAFTPAPEEQAAAAAGAATPRDGDRADGEGGGGDDGGEGGGGEGDADSAGEERGDHLGDGMPRRRPGSASRRRGMASRGGRSMAHNLPTVDLGGWEDEGDGDDGNSAPTASRRGPAVPVVEGMTASVDVTAMAAGPGVGAVGRGGRAPPGGGMSTADIHLDMTDVTDAGRPGRPAALPTVDFDLTDTPASPPMRAGTPTGASRAAGSGGGASFGRAGKREPAKAPAAAVPPAAVAPPPLPAARRMDHHRTRGLDSPLPTETVDVTHPFGVAGEGGGHGVRAGAGAGSAAPPGQPASGGAPGTAGTPAPPRRTAAGEVAPRGGGGGVGGVGSDRSYDSARSGGALHGIVGAGSVDAPDATTAATGMGGRQAWWARWFRAAARRDAVAVQPAGAGAIPSLAAAGDAGAVTGRRAQGAGGGLAGGGAGGALHTTHRYGLKLSVSLPFFGVDATLPSMWPVSPPTGSAAAGVGNMPAGVSLSATRSNSAAGGVAVPVRAAVSPARPGGAAFGATPASVEAGAAGKGSPAQSASSPTAVPSPVIVPVAGPLPPTPHSIGAAAATAGAHGVDGRSSQPPAATPADGGVLLPLPSLNATLQPRIRIGALGGRSFVPAGSTPSPVISPPPLPPAPSTSLSPGSAGSVAQFAPEAAKATPPSAAATPPPLPPRVAMAHPVDARLSGGDRGGDGDAPAPLRANRAAATQRTPLPPPTVTAERIPLPPAALGGGLAAVRTAHALQVSDGDLTEGGGDVTGGWAVDVSDRHEAGNGGGYGGGDDGGDLTEAPSPPFTDAAAGPHGGGAAPHDDDLTASAGADSAVMHGVDLSDQWGSGEDMTRSSAPQPSSPPLTRSTPLSRASAVPSVASLPAAPPPAPASGKASDVVRPAASAAPLSSPTRPPTPSGTRGRAHAPGGGAGHSADADVTGGPLGAAAALPAARGGAAGGAGGAIALPSSPLPLTHGVVRAAPIPVAPGMHCRVLVVDDDGASRRLLVRMFERRCKAKADELDDGAHLVSTVSSARSSGQPFAMVFMDIHMRVMGGLAATRALRAAGDSTPVVAVTGDADEEAAELMEAGFVAVINKPVQAHQAVSLLRRWTLFNDPAWSMA
jgi:CheY-like chemotaxis protein/signal transduction histidine kinase